MCAYIGLDSVTISRCPFKIDDFLSCSFPAYLVRFLSPKVMRHDTEDLMWPKRPMTGRPGPLVQPDASCTILTFSRAWPSPLWAYNTFSYVLCLSFSSDSSLFLSLLSHSTLTCDPFHSIWFHSLLFSVVLYVSAFGLWFLSLCVYKPLYDW